MAMREQWIGKNLTCQLDGFPLRNLADDDDAMVVQYLNPRAEAPKMDLNGEVGVHVVNVETSASVTLKFPIGATETLIYLNTAFQTQRQWRTFTAKYLGSDTSSVLLNNVVISDTGTWGGGKNPVMYTFTFTATKGKIVYGGARILP